VGGGRGGGGDDNGSMHNISNEGTRIWERREKNKRTKLSKRGQRRKKKSKKTLPVLDIRRLKKTGVQRGSERNTNNSKKGGKTEVIFGKPPPTKCGNNGGPLHTAPRPPPPPPTPKKDRGEGSHAGGASDGEKGTEGSVEEGGCNKPSRAPRRPPQKQSIVTIPPGLEKEGKRYPINDIPSSFNNERRRLPFDGAGEKREFTTLGKLKSQQLLDRAEHQALPHRDGKERNSVWDRWGFVMSRGEGGRKGRGMFLSETATKEWWGV